MLNYIIKAILNEDGSVAWQVNGNSVPVAKLMAHQRAIQRIELATNGFIVNDGETVKVSFFNAEKSLKVDEETMFKRDGVQEWFLSVPALVHNTPGEWEAQFFIVDESGNVMPSQKTVFVEYSSIESAGIEMVTEEQVVELWENANNAKRVSEEAKNIATEKAQIAVDSATECEEIKQEILELKSKSGTIITVNGEAQATWDADTKVDKLRTANRLYGTGSNGNDRGYLVGSSMKGGEIPMRNENGNIQTKTPFAGYDCANKEYVDSYESLKTLPLSKASPSAVIGIDANGTVEKRSISQNIPSFGDVAIYTTGDNLRTSTPLEDRDCIPLKYFNENKGAKLLVHNEWNFKEYSYAYDGKIYLDTAWLMMFAEGEAKKGDLFIGADRWLGKVIKHYEEVVNETIGEIIGYEVEFLGYRPQEEVKPTKMYRHNIRLSKYQSSASVYTTFTVISSKSTALTAEEIVAELSEQTLVCLYDGANVKSHILSMEFNPGSPIVDGRLYPYFFNDDTNQQFEWSATIYDTVTEI